jgi:hypothetical protein
MRVRRDVAAEHHKPNGLVTLRHDSCDDHPAMAGNENGGKGMADGSHAKVPASWRWLVCTPAGFAALPAHAFLLQGEALDAVASWLALIVLIVVPIVGITAFWLVHVLPEKIAHKRHHPQFEAIRTLCLLSLVFGGLLWPFAWLWAYTKPVGYKLAYGTDKSPDYYKEHGLPDPHDEPGVVPAKPQPEPGA